eukprot:GILK01001525.1.p1 GENE.GILK01001525.1~~GILK01001525.1.p1  ORF type:complete len:894 (-),score=148.33 GILK01001525.1:161-2842(-)
MAISQEALLGSSPVSAKTTSLKRIAIASFALVGVIGLIAVLSPSTIRVASETLFSTRGPTASYTLTNVAKTPRSITGDLTLAPDTFGPFGNDVSKLRLEVSFNSNYRVRVRIFDPANERFEVPQYVVDTTAGAEDPLDHSLYDFSYTESPFSFTVKRKADGDVLFSTVGYPIFFSAQYVELSTSLPHQPNIYGLGERTREFRLDSNDKIYTIFAKDQMTPYDDGSGDSKQTYGSHPFYLDYRGSGNAHGVLLLNAHGMDISLRNDGLTYKTIGGVIDLFVFAGPEPDTVLKQYHKLIGLPSLPPYWSLGFHQCRWGYDTLEKLQTVVQKFKDNKLPLDTIWNDIDYFDDFKDFTTDPKRFPLDKFKSFLDSIHADGLHYVPILDAGIAKRDDSASYQLGLEQNIYLMNPSGEKPLLAKVWPGYAVYPDFFHPNTTAYWSGQLAGLYESGVEFDGLWLDMNEVSNFCNGECTDETNKLRSAAVVYPNGLDPENPPYVPGRARLNEKTALMAAKHYGVLEYDVHNLFGFMESQVSSTYIREKLKKRPMIISRSTFAGHGRNGGHWLGDNRATYTDMFWSIPGIFNFQMFGIPLVGADVCGFAQDTNAELCSRWMALGSFYPFYRNHNHNESIPQEPYALGDTVLTVSRKFLRLRYSLLPFWYTQFALVSSNGGSVVQPLFFEFPQDLQLAQFDRQFMVGHSLLVSPVLEEGATQLGIYLPAARWFDFYTGEEVGDSVHGELITVQTPIDHLPVHIRGGSVIPRHQIGASLSTAESRQMPLTLLVALDKDQRASGALFLDDGESLDTIDKDLYSFVNFVVADNTLTSVPLKVNYEPAVGQSLTSITVYGVNCPTAPTVQFNGRAVPAAFNSELNVLVVPVEPVAITTAFTLKWCDV